MKRITLAIALAVVGLSASVYAADTNMRQPVRRMDAKRNFLASLNLTDAQKKDLSALKLETEKRAIELRAETATARLELRHLLMADAPDQSAIDKKMAQVSKCETDVRMNRINGWFAANKLLTPEQQKVWIKALRAGTVKAMAHHAGMRRPMRHEGRPMEPSHNME